MLGEPLVAASHARAAAVTGDLASALILVSAAETLARTSAEDAGELAALAFGTVRPAQPEWLDLSRRCLSVLCRAQHAAQAITVADQILARVDDANLAAQVETEAARALWLSGRVHDLASRIERTLRSSDLDALVTVRLRAAYALARTRTLPGEPAAREAAGAVEQARDSGDREALTLAVQAAGEAARNQGRHQVALRHFRELRSPHRRAVPRRGDHRAAVRGPLRPRPGPARSSSRQLRHHHRGFAAGRRLRADVAGLQSRAPR